MNSENKKTILLVEDEALIAIMEKKLLEKKGYTVHTISTGEKAVETIIENILPVDLILMDIDLGSGIDGTVAAAQILDHKDIPVVFLSSHTEPEVVEKTEKITSYGYVVKNSGIIVLDASIKMAFRLFDFKMAYKQKEEELTKSEYQYRMLFENMNVSFAVHEAIYDEKGNPVDFRYLDMNPMFLKNLGRDASTIRGRTAKELFPNTEQYWIDIFGKVAKTGEPVSFQNYSGELNQWFNTYIFSPQKNRFASFFIDITEQKQAEEALKAKNEEFESANEELTAALEELEAANEELISANQSIQQADESLRKSEAIKNKMVSNIGDVIVIIDEKGINRYKSPNITKLFGWEPEELVGKNTWDNIHPDDLEAGQSFFKTILKEPDAVGTIELRYKRKDGNYVWIEISVINLLKDRDIQGILGNYHDITDRKQAEEELRTERELVKRIIENGPIAITQVNCEGKIIFANKHAEQLFGLEKTSIEDLSYNSPEWLITDVDGSPFPEERLPFRQVMSTGQPVYDVQHAVSRTGTDRKILSINGAPLHDEQGRLNRVVFAIQDITGRKEAEKKIRKQLAEKELLLLEVHHRVKNNIANIEGLLFLQADSTGIPEVKAGLEDALFRIKSMRILYEKLLLSSDYDDISIKSYMESLIDLFIIAFNVGENIIIDKQITDFTITAKKAVSAGIIINELLTNVFKYAFKGREGGTVSVLVKKEGNTATLIIHDNGVGIDDRIKADISPGFGLTIVKMLAEQLKGTYSIANENGTKSVLQFEI